MTAILRNLISVARRFQLAAYLNILGLSVAFAAFMIIMIQLDYDFSFDKFHKDYDKIFRVEISYPNLTRAVICRPFAEHFFESSPHILAGALTQSMEGRTSFYLENEGVRHFYEETTLTVSPDFADVFTFDFVEGSKEALKTPNIVAIPLSLSSKLFGNQPAVGRQLDNFTTVGAVYRDFPSNTIVKNYIYRPLPENENIHGWNNNNYHVYIRVNHPSNAPLLLGNFKRIMEDDKSIFGGQEILWYGENISLRLTALPDIHFTTDVTYDNTPKASRQILLFLFAVAILIVVIATINFTNFSTALTPMRVKSLNTQHILGLRRSKLRFALVLEAVVVCFVSYIVALLLVDLFKNTPLSRLIDGDLAYSANPVIFIGTALVAMLVGFLAGLYPSRYMTSFEPAFVLKGSFGLSGKNLRNTLIGIQYVASLALITGASFMYLQNNFMKHGPLGYDKDNLIVTNISTIYDSRDAFANQIKSYPGIEDVTYAQFLLSSRDQYMGWGRRYKGDNISFQCLPVHYTFLEVMGIEITEGRNFRQEDGHTIGTSAYIFNETARQLNQLELNTSLDEGGEIVGFMPDVKFASFRSAVEPMAFYVHNQYRTAFAHIRLNAGADKRAAMSHINSTLAEFDADYQFALSFYDEVVQKLYEKESSLSSLISLFSILAIFISIVGVFGLVVFDSERRRKEIGIRKVFGASNIEIIIMFNKAYLKILLICFAIAAPLAWYAVNRWLENFAYKTPMHWWVYLLAFAAVGFITVCTVTFQNWKVANDNPIKSIKSCE